MLHGRVRALSCHFALFFLVLFFCSWFLRQHQNKQVYTSERSVAETESLLSTGTPEQIQSSDDASSPSPPSYTATTVFSPPLLSFLVRNVLVLVNTCEKFLSSRAAKIVRTWARGFAPENLVFVSDHSSHELLRPHPVWHFGHGSVGVPSASASNVELDRVHYAEAQSRFLRALAQAGQTQLPQSVRWVLLVDDDVFVHADNLAKLTGSLEESHSMYYAEGPCGENRRSACGGGGILFPLHVLQRTAVRLRGGLFLFLLVVLIKLKIVERSYMRAQRTKEI
jgi:hypothetical protein